MNIAKLIVFSVLLMMIAGCSQQSQEKKEQNDCFCITIFDPVCADEATYSNSCFAECAGKTDYTKGACPE